MDFEEYLQLLGGLQLPFRGRRPAGTLSLALTDGGAV